MRARALVVILVAVGGGCIPRQPLGAGEMDRYWYLHADVRPAGQPEALSMGGQKLPGRWVLRQEPSLALSTASMIAAVEKLKAGPDEIEIAVSPDHAEMAGKLLGQVREAITSLREIAKPESARTAGRWADTVAGALRAAEDIARLAEADTPTPPGKPPGETLGWSAEPVIQMLVGYLDQRSGGSLLAGIDAGQVTRIRQVLTQVFLRVGFALAGKTEPTGLGESVLRKMREAPSPEALAESLRAALLEGLAEAPPAPPGGALRTALNAVLLGAPPMLRALEAFVGQWDQMESLAVEFSRRAGESLVTVTIRVAPGRRVRIGDLFTMQPALVFRGGSRIVVLPSSPTTGEAVVLFEPIADGSTEVRFDGLGYAMVRLLALPLANAAVREVRVATGTTAGRRMITVAMLMEAGGDRKDPRRLIAFHDVREVRLVRGPFAIFRQTRSGAQSFTYLTPSHRYTYRRERTPAQK